MSKLEQVASDLEEKITAQAAEAVKQAKLAYEFAPNSYTHSAMVAARDAERALSMFRECR